MSDSLYANLVLNIEREEVKSFLLDHKLEGYIQTVGSNVTAVALKKHDQIGDDTAEELSLKLNTSVLNIYYYEDFGWGFNLFISGDKLSTFSVNFETKELIKNQFPQENLMKLGAFAKLIDVINTSFAVKNREQCEAKGWEVFIEALNIQIDNNFCFESLESLPENFLARFAIEKIQNKKKQLPFKKILSKTLEPLMEKRGLYLDSSTDLPYDLMYYKRIQNIVVGLSMMKNGNSITPRIKTLYDEIFVFEPTNKIFNSEEDLQLIIKQIVEVYDKYTDENESEFIFQPFDYELLFNNEIHPFLSSLGYKIIESDINKLISGGIIYKKSDKEIHFKHGKYFIALVCKIKINNRIKNIRDINPNANRKSQIFKSKDEYLELLNNYKIALEEIIEQLR